MTTPTHEEKWIENNAVTKKQIRTDEDTSDDAYFIELDKIQDKFDQIRRDAKKELLDEIQKQNICPIIYDSKTNSYVKSMAFEMFQRDTLRGAK